MDVCGFFNFRPSIFDARLPRECHQLYGSVCENSVIMYGCCRHGKSCIIESQNRHRYSFEAGDISPVHGSVSSPHICSFPAQHWRADEGGKSKSSVAETRKVAWKAGLRSRARL
eukprot:6214665-Pleurochrysis_carterae.AAC.2